MQQQATTITAGSEQAAAAQTDQRPRVVIVDDNEVIRALLQEICEENGWAVTTAATAADAILAAGLQRTDLVLLDFHLGDSGDPLEPLRALRAISPGTPIVVVTGQSPEIVGPAVKQAGGEEVVGKPCSVAQVSALLGRYRPNPVGSEVPR